MYDRGDDRGYDYDYAVDDDNNNRLVFMRVNVMT